MEAEKEEEQIGVGVGVQILKKSGKEEIGNNERVEKDRLCD